jgi:hypothetical protein
MSQHSTFLSGLPLAALIGINPGEKMGRGAWP